MISVGCRESGPAQHSKQTPPPAAPAAPLETPTKVDIPVPIDDPDRWLFVEKVAGKAKGGWATGSFDEERNKLSITTSEVEEFAVDTSRIKIDWKKLVVLSIDGKNSELRKREYETLHFRRQPHGEWAVRDP